ncbi:hypothetical protein [Streptomyces kaempferi]|uniref:Uncharacterized protein n=1 Tax=Streptomyces kaempferi TaxID=333725 RepID=A0ABW3XP83_9ACTN
MATELSRDQLPGNELAVHVNLTANADTNVAPEDFRFNAPAPDGPPSAPRRHRWCSAALSASLEP